MLSALRSLIQQIETYLNEFRDQVLQWINPPELRPQEIEIKPRTPKPPRQ